MSRAETKAATHQKILDWNLLTLTGSNAKYMDNVEGDLPEERTHFKTLHDIYIHCAAYTGLTIEQVKRSLQYVCVKNQITIEEDRDAGGGRWIWQGIPRVNLAKIYVPVNKKIWFNIYNQELEKRGIQLYIEKHMHESPHLEKLWNSLRDAMLEDVQDRYDEIQHAPVSSSS